MTTPDPLAPVRHRLSRIDQKAIHGIAHAEMQFQMTRPFSRYFIAGLNEHQQNVVRCLIRSAVQQGIEAYEHGRKTRQASDV